jgi:hypothetical protein
VGSKVETQYRYASSVQYLHHATCNILFNDLHMTLLDVPRAHLILQGRSPMQTGVFLGTHEEVPNLKNRGEP